MKLVLILVTCCAFGSVAAACGDGDSPEGSGDGGAGGSGGAGAGGAPAACPGGPLDDYVKELVGKPCSEEGEECASNNGCGGCSVTCKNGVWESTDGQLCYSIGAAC
jgi:hypothetical protein